ncbi:MAG TPA: hypothetical protein VGA22_09195 [Gemmatimonadales bacterium]|jgi:hypothetical protein
MTEYGRAGIGVLVAALLVSVTACADDYIEVRSVIEWDLAGVQVTLPDHFDVGVPAPVSVMTLRVICDKDGRTVVTEDGLLVVIEPYDLKNIKSTACPDAGISGPRTANVIVGQAGEVTVRVIGLSGVQNSVITVEYTVPAQ